MKRALLTALLPLWAISVHAQQTQAAGRPCVAAPGGVAHAFHGEVNAGQRYEQRLGRYVIRLDPDDNPNLPVSFGWNMGVFEPGRADDLSQFTTPFSGPNHRDIFAWIGTNGQPMNVPGAQRTIYFSPEVGRSIRWEDDTAKRRLNLERIESYGRGDLEILEYRVGPAVRDLPAPPLTWIKFAGCLAWSEQP